MRRAVLFLVMAFALTVPGTVFGQEAAKTPELEDLIPDHSFAFVSVNDFSSMCDQARRTSMAKLWNEPELQQFLAPALEFLGQQMGQMEREIGHSVEDLLSFLQGQVALGLVEFDPMYGGMVPDMVLLADLGARRVEFERIHGAALAEAADDLRLRQMSHGGVPYQQMVLPQGIELSLAYLGDAMVLTSHPERMPAVIDAWRDKGGTALAANPTFKKVVERTGGGAAFFRIFVNVEAILGFFADQMDPQTLRIMEVTGLSGLRGAGWSMSFVAEGIRDSIYMHAPGEKRGLMAAMYSSPGDGKKLLARVPRDAFYAAAGRADLDEIGGVLLQMLGEIEPFMLDEAMVQLAEVEEFLGLRIREDLLRPFGEEHALFATLPEDGGIIPNLVFMTRLRDPERLMNSLEQVVARVRMMVEDNRRLSVEHRRLDFMGKVIHYIHVGNRWGDPFPVTPCLALDGNVLYLALYPQVLKDVVARGKDGPSILTRPDFQRVMKGLPKDLDSMEYVDFQAAVRLLYGTLVPLAQMFGKSEEIPLDVALLPRTETIARHFFGGGWGLAMKDDGVVFHSYTPMGMAPVMAMFVAPAIFLMSAEGEMMLPVEVSPLPVPMPVPEETVGEAKVRLEEIYVGLLFHYAQTDGYPKALGELVKSQALDGAGVLLLPGDDDPMDAGGGVKSSFVYMGRKVGHILDGQDDAVWVYERPRGAERLWVLFASGEIRQVGLTELSQFIAATQEMLK